MKPLIVGISGINATDNPGPGVGVARSLMEDTSLDVKIVGLAYDALEPGIYLDWLFDKTFLLPYPSVGPGPFMKRIFDIKKTHGLDFIIPNLDAELPIYTRFSSEFENRGIHLFVPNEAQYQLRDKVNIPAVAKKIGIKAPKTHILYTWDQLSTAIQALGLPLMVKGSFYGAHLSQTPGEAIKNFNKLSAEWGFPIIAQNIVKGEEINLVGVGDGKGKMIGQVAVKKLSTTSLGKIWTGVTIKNQPLLAAANRFVEAYKWKGPFEMECMVNGSDIYLIEINPRFPAWSYFATGVGVNLPCDMIKTALNIPGLGKIAYDAGKLFVRYTYETVCNMDRFQEITINGEF